MITVKNVTKKYGKFKAVDNISFEVNDGEIIGLLGPNGAGKSTLLKILNGNINYDSGNINYNDENILNELKLRVKKITDKYPLWY